MALLRGQPRVGAVSRGGEEAGGGVDPGEGQSGPSRVPTTVEGGAARTEPGVVTHRGLGREGVRPFLLGTVALNLEAWRRRQTRKVYTACKSCTT